MLNKLFAFIVASSLIVGSTAHAETPPQVASMPNTAIPSLTRLPISDD